ncbi:MAG: hypothetical protein LIO79_00310 [Rikenellaceae bacterium]|nr:hypothetical protein [Rikenellaceae bacterium]
MERKYRNTIFIVCGIIAFIFIAVFGTELWLEHKIKQIIRTEPASLVNGQYDADAGRVTVNLINRTVVLGDVIIKGAQSGNSLGDSLLRSVDLKCKSLALSGIKFSKKNGIRRISVKKISVVNPDAVIAVNSGISRKPKEKRDNPKVVLDDLSSSDIEIKNGNIQVESWTGGVKEIYTLKNLNLRAADLDLDSLGSVTPHVSGDVRVSAGKFTYQFQSGMMLLDVNDFTLNTKKGTFAVSSVNLDPQEKKYDFAYKDPEHSDWTKISTGKITGRGLDINKYITEKILKIDSIAIAGVDVESYKNRKIQVRNKIKPLFYESLQKSDVKIDIPVIQVTGINVTYEELAEEGEYPGRIRFNDINGTFYGLTNIAGGSGKEYYKLIASGKLEDAGQLNATFLFPVSPSTNHFEVSGKLGYMQLRNVNGMVQPLADARIEEGEINSFDFHISGTSTRSYVRMTLLYSDLKVELLKEKDGVFKERRFLSFLADTFVIKPSNPHRGDTRNVMAEADRDPYRSQFNYLWKSLLAGIKKTAI